MAFTNHALDHMLSSILDDKITSNIVRMGSRSSDERILEYTLDKLERTSESSRNSGERRLYKAMKDMERDIVEVMESIQLPSLSWGKVDQFLQIQYSEHALAFSNPPYWVQRLFDAKHEDEVEHGAWEMAGGRGKKKAKDILTDEVLTIYRFWRECHDLQYIQPMPMLPAGYDPAVLAFFESLGFGLNVPPTPFTTRPLDTLLEDDFANPWSMSASERRLISSFWEERIRSEAYEIHVDEFYRLREEYKRACREHQEVRDEVRFILFWRRPTTDCIGRQQNRRKLLSQCDLIACTTTGNFLTHQHFWFCHSHEFNRCNKVDFLVISKSH